MEEGEVMMGGGVHSGIGGDGNEWAEGVWCTKCCNKNVQGDQNIREHAYSSKFKRKTADKMNRSYDSATETNGKW